MVPAKEVIHDVNFAPYHPLCGISPIQACGLAATQGLEIQRSSTRFFERGAKPAGVLTAPGHINDDTARRLKEYWEANFTGENVGRTAVLGDGLKYEPMIVNPHDAQLIDQLRWIAETVCSAFHFLLTWSVSVSLRRTTISRPLIRRTTRSACRA
jgi:HK97 family phage portal protein